MTELGTPIGDADSDLEPDMTLWSEFLAWRRPIRILPDEAFDCPGNHVRPLRTALGKHIHDGVASRNMAGSAFRPSFTEFTDFVVKPRQNALERGYVRELFLQMHPVERKLLRYNMGATVFELARALRNARIDTGCLADWINQFATGYSTPSDLSKIADYWQPSRHMPMLTQEEIERLESTPI